MRDLAPPLRDLARPSRELAPRLLFVPVSGAFGMGEYARSLAIAQGAAGLWPGASIHFVLSRAASYAAQTPFATTLLAASPTFHSAAVIDLMRAFGPDVVLFDNAGRTAQLRAAKRLGARVVYISARRRQRFKAFRFRWMRLIDEHWIAYPKFIAGELGFVERLKLRLLARPTVRYLDVVLARGRAQASDLPASTAITGDYVLVVPGGGTGHPGAAAGAAVERFLDAARTLAATGIATVFVGRAADERTVENSSPEDAPSPEEVPSPKELPSGRLVMRGAVPQAELAELMRGARLVIANGGSTLLQAIACGRACIAIPIAGDQAERIRRCVAAKVAVAAPLESAKIAAIAEEWWRNDAALNALAGRAAALGLADGVDVALRALTDLLTPA